MQLDSGFAILSGPFGRKGCVELDSFARIRPFMNELTHALDLLFSPHPGSSAKGPIRGSAVVFAQRHRS